MNRIIYAKHENIDGCVTAKSFTFLVSDSGETVVVPPLKSFDARGFTGIKLVVDGALLPFKEVRTLGGDGTLAFCAKQAVKYLGGAIEKKELILGALGNLLVSYAAFVGAESLSPAVETVLVAIGRGVTDCEFSVRDAIKKLPLNYDYVRKLFKKEVGATPAEYLLKERMNLAQQLILGGASNRFTRFSVSQIAEACGFSEPLYFSRVFKKYFGVSPSEYK